MRAMGHLWLWLGFLAAAFSSVYQLEVADNKWSTIPWGWYTFSMCIGIAGVAALRHAKQKDHADVTQTAAEYSVVQESLAQVAEIVQQMADQEQHAPSQVLRCIDDQCAEPLSNFADSRQALVKRFGLQVYAEIMTEFAAAERYINRSWSAAADGYVAEVKASLSRASHHLQEAKKLMAAAEAGMQNVA